MAAKGGVTYPGAPAWLLIADGGGRKGSHLRVWQTQLQPLADQTQRRIAICPLPPGTSKWNKIEHRMVAYSTQHWRGRPLTSHEVIVNRIGNTTTQTGLHIHAELDTNRYATGKRITDERVWQRKRPNPNESI